MIQDLEAVIDESGKVKLLTEVRLKESRRALVTILDETPTEAKASRKENLRAVFAKMRDVKMFRGVESASEWQRNLRDEWE
jgi:hypothetical protein